MTLYSINTLIEETRRLAAEFRRTTGTMLPVSGEIARYDVCHLLKLTPVEERGKGYDAIGCGRWENQKIQIKSRIICNTVKSGHRIGKLNLDADWDLIMLSLMDNNFAPLEIYELCRDTIEQTLSSDNKPTKRGTISVAKCKVIGQLVWARSLGVCRI